eukprot:CAMPEP_0177787076 /NCGR_PEP_ID=MMETSP0491_2-20121128/21274_1 /TAXON_ID=63592 /ORGANISM="Tetraselmis chuii, Strain PLY429" /LENGTH=438 /DNA_ID=CAMNT_0019308351 /DNA_START=113 /DNA_END=1429 /DNA_ORIENTATION=+
MQSPIVLSYYRGGFSWWLIWVTALAVHVILRSAGVAAVAEYSAPDAVAVGDFDTKGAYSSSPQSVSPSIRGRNRRAWRHPNARTTAHANDDVMTEVNQVATSRQSFAGFPSEQRAGSRSNKAGARLHHYEKKANTTSPLIRRPRGFVRGHSSVVEEQSLHPLSRGHATVAAETVDEEKSKEWLMTKRHPAFPHSSKRGRVVVLQYSDRLPKQGVFQRYGQRNREYCALHGYDYLREPNQLDLSKSLVWSYSWQKLLMVLAAFESGKYDYAVWLDDDACISDRHMGTRVEDFFRDGEHAMVLARGSHNGVYNTGVLFFRDSPDLKDLIHLWLNDTEHCPDSTREKHKCCPEQDCLYQIWNKVQRTPYQDLAPFPAFSRHAEYNPHPLFSRLVRPLYDFDFSCSPAHPPNWPGNKCVDPFIFHYAGSKKQMADIFDKNRK